MMMAPPSLKKKKKYNYHSFSAANTNSFIPASVYIIFFIPTIFYVVTPVHKFDFRLITIHDPENGNEYSNICSLSNMFLIQPVYSPQRDSLQIQDPADAIMVKRHAPELPKVH